METFSATKNLARVSAGLSAGGPFLKKPNRAPKMTFVEGWPSTVTEKLMHKGIKQGAVQDPWVYRRPGSNL